MTMSRHDSRRETGLVKGGQTHPRSKQKRLTIGLAMALLVAVLLSISGWAIRHSRNAQATYSVLRHHLETWGQVTFGQTLTARGQISGTVRGVDGIGLSGATVVVSTRWGHTFSTQTDDDGHYVLTGVPVGRSVPAATCAGYQAQVYGRSKWRHGRTVRVRADKTTPDIYLEMIPISQSTLPTEIGQDAVVQIRHTYPVTTTASRTAFQFEREGYIVEGWIYEPSPLPQTRVPGLIAAYPGYALNWEPASMAFVAEGYVVLAITPVSMRGSDIAEDTQDLAAAITLFRQGMLSKHVDPERLIALGGSFSAMALTRSLHISAVQKPETTVQGIVLMGPITDLYDLRRAAYFDGYEGFKITPDFERVLWSLGRPDRVPRMYIENSTVFHTRGLPPLCVIHGTGDEIIPHTQSERLSEVMSAIGHPHELTIYADTGHYPGIYDPDPVTEAMYQQIIAFFREQL